jgi:hypothetical protein
MKLIFSIILALVVLVFPTSVNADGSCLPLYNGGVTTKQYCQLPTPTPTSTTIQQTGGQTVYPSQKTNTTPDTGPATWSIFGLFFLAGAGFLLRNKAKT